MDENGDKLASSHNMVHTTLQHPVAMCRCGLEKLKSPQHFENVECPRT
jgi:hypothetical protein